MAGAFFSAAEILREEEKRILISTLPVLDISTV